MRAVMTGSPIRRRRASRWWGRRSRAGCVAAALVGMSRRRSSNAPKSSSSSGSSGSPSPSPSAMPAVGLPEHVRQLGVGAVRDERGQGLVVEDGGESGPAPGGGHRGEPFADPAQAEPVQGGAVGGSGEEERQLLAGGVAARGERGRRRPGDRLGHHDDPRDPGASGPFGPGAQRGEHDRAQVTRVRVRRVGDEAVGELAGHLADAPVDPAGVERRGRGRQRAGIEVRLQPGEAVVAALVLQGLAGAERGEDRPDRGEVVAQVLDRPLPRHREAADDVAAHLGGQTELEAALGEPREVPRGVRGHHRAAGEGQRHAGAYGDPAGVLGREQRDRQGVVRRLGDVHGVEAEPFDARHDRGHLAQRRRRRQRRGQLHPGGGCL